MMAKEQFRVLYRQFLFRMVDLEILSAHAQGDSSKLLGQFASLLLFTSILLGLPSLGGFDRMTPEARMVALWSFEHLLILTNMLVVGLFAVLCWDSTFPDRRDVLVLAPLPVRARTLFLAKVTAVAASLGLTVVMLHAVAGLLWPIHFARDRTARVAPEFTERPALAPVKAAGMQAVLDRDLAPALRPSGLLDPANGMGVTIGVLTQGERRVFTYGAAKPDSIFEIASISKTFTATVLAQMVEQGRVRLDEPVRELLPPGTVEKPEGREITLIDLATHHSGLPRTAGNIRPDGNANADYTPADLFAYIGRHGVRKPPDASFSYSNLGFALLGQALANRAGMSYADLVKQVVTGPLGLRDTAVTLDAERQARLITGHRLGGDAVEPWVLDAQAPAGGIYSTAGDLLLYLDAQLHPERLAELGAAIRETHVLRADIGGMDVASESGVRLGMAWMHGARHGIYFHGGNARGETSLAFFSPAGDYAGVVLVNMTASPMEVVETLGQHLRRRLAGEAPLSFAQVVVPAGGGLGGWLRSLAAYWLTMLASGAFLFCCVLALQGLAAQLLPRRMFLRMSSFLQMGAFCLFVCGYFLQPLFATPDTLTAATNGGVLVWSPSYWFLGLFQALNGSPALAPLARRAMIALPVAIGSAAISYLLCYVRTLRKIVEEPDILPGARGVRWLPAFGNRFDTAVAQFSVRTLLRSRQHRMILAFYLGVGFALLIFFVKSPPAQQLLAASAGNPWRQVNSPMLVASILMMAFCIVGMRMVFALPLDLRANWIFRLMPLRGGPACLKARRRAMLALGVAPLWAIAAAVFLWLWPWQPAVGHLAALGLFAITLAEVCLRGQQKIPFTCSYLPGRSNLHVTFWVCILLLVRLVDAATRFERAALEDVALYATMAGVLAAAAAVARWFNREAVSEGAAPPEFEAEDPGALQVLGLSGTGPGVQ